MGVRLSFLYLYCFIILTPVLSQVDDNLNFGGYRITAGLLEDFEKKLTWSSAVTPHDQGLAITTQMRKGCPAALPMDDKGVLQALPKTSQTQQWVLGVKIEIKTPGVYEVVLVPAKPVQAGKVVKSFSCWVYGNNLPDSLVGMFSDKDREALYALELGRLNFTGWKKLTAAFPGDPQQAAGPVFFSGLKLILSPLDLQEGTLYYYFDFITAIAEEPADE